MRGRSLQTPVLQWPQSVRVEVVVVAMVGFIVVLVLVGVVFMVGIEVRVVFRFMVGSCSWCGS